MRLNLFCTLVLVATGLSCATPHGDGSLDKKGIHNPLVNVVKPFLGIGGRIYNHTLYKTERAKSDCQPNCPLVDVWQYKYQPEGQPLITSSEPISTKKEHWKAKQEARIIAISLFGTKDLYFNGLVDFIESFKVVKEASGIKEPAWGYETFTVRVYVPKRNPTRLAEMGEFPDVTPESWSQKLLSLGCELAYVDNALPQAKLDGTFWRFMVAAEDMPEGQKIRYLVRDADWLATGSEAFAIGEWMASNYQFHRNHQVELCLGPLTIFIWSGSHVGKSPFSDMKVRIENYPYRLQYGDDESFTRDMVWPRMKYLGSVLTHLNNRGGWATMLANPYRGSCEEPTQLYCDSIKKGGRCEDRAMPKEIYSPMIELGLRRSLAELRSRHDLFDAHLGTERGMAVRKVLSVN